MLRQAKCLSYVIPNTKHLTFFLNFSVSTAIAHLTIKNIELTKLITVVFSGIEQLTISSLS